MKVRGQDVTVKTVSLKDNTDTIKVSLWRDLAEPSFVGKFLQMTNVVVTAFNDEISISSTSKTDLKVNYLKETSFHPKTVKNLDNSISITIFSDRKLNLLL